MIQAAQRFVTLIFLLTTHQANVTTTLRKTLKKDASVARGPQVNV